MILAVSRWAKILKTSLHIKKKKKVGPSDPMLEKLGQDPISKYKIALPLERFPRLLCLFPPPNNMVSLPGVMNKDLQTHTKKKGVFIMYFLSDSAINKTLGPMSRTTTTKVRRLEKTHVQEGRGLQHSWRVHVNQP